MQGGTDCQSAEGTYECKIQTGSVESCGNARIINGFNTCAGGMQGGPGCQSVEGTYKGCKMDLIVKELKERMNAEYQLKVWKLI